MTVLTPGSAAANPMCCLLQPAGSLVAKTRSLDQARAVVTFLDAASEKTLRSTVALTAARGRGKSAALGLAIAGALALGYSNIFVTAPSPENLRTLFEFIFKVGLVATRGVCPGPQRPPGAFFAVPWLL